MGIELRLLGAADAQDYKRVRLNALKLAPTAFGSSWETTRELPDEFFTQRATAQPDNFIFGAFDDRVLIGICGAFVEPDIMRNHIANVVGMWVEPSHRSRGIARRLVDAVIEALQALPQVTSIQLSVTASNINALQLYEDCGFKIWGQEPDAIKVDGAYYDELHMVLALDPSK